MASSRYFGLKVLFCRTTVAVVPLVLLSGPAFAKAPELSAIEVYPTADGQGYVQITGFVLNGKNEVHLCSGQQTINKNSYGKLPKVVLAAGMSLERVKNGELQLSRGGAPECVVPGNLKLEKAEGANALRTSGSDRVDGADRLEIDQLHGKDSPGRSWGQDCAGNHPGHRVGRVPACPEVGHDQSLEVLSGQISLRSTLRRRKSLVVELVCPGGTGGLGGLSSFPEGHSARLRETCRLRRLL